MADEADGRTTPKTKPDLRAALMPLLREMLVSAIHDGRIETSGRSDDDIRKQLQALIRKLPSDSDEPLEIVTDHSPVLLAKAREAAGDGSYEIATLLYATWCEHWINRVILVTLQRRKLSDEVGLRIIRELRFESKLTWFLEVLGLTPIDESARKAVSHLAELRNQFVHYKYTPTTTFFDRKEIERLQKAIQNLELHIEKLEAYSAFEVEGGARMLATRVIASLFGGTDSANS